MVGALVLGVWNLELPYLAFSSGPVSDAADAIVADEVDTYPPEGELLMLTVISQEVNLFEALIAGVDPSIDLVPREAFRRPRRAMRTTGRGAPADGRLSDQGHHGRPRASRL